MSYDPEKNQDFAKTKTWSDIPPGMPELKPVFYFVTKKAPIVPIGIPPFINRPDQESPEIVASYLANEIFDSKSALDIYSSENMYKARKKLDAEEISERKRNDRRFINRASVKIAEVDSLVGLVHSVPSRPRFVDICGGPGGFTEYMLWRTRNTARGWGITLKTGNNLDWKLSDMKKNKIDTSRFSIHDGRDGTGDITKPENMSDFIDNIFKKNYGKGVEIALADGAFSTTGQENKQEQLTWHLIFCELLIALSTLAPKGHIVCKFFDCFSERTVQLIYLVSTYFEKVAIVKPETSRSANSEKYIVFYRFRGRARELLKWMAEMSRHLYLRNDLTLLPLRLLDDKMSKIDPDFYQWIYTTNNQLAEKQNRSLSRLLNILAEQE